MDRPGKQPGSGVRLVASHRVEGDGHRVAEDAVIVEDTLTIEIGGVGSYTLMWTPTGVEGTAHGYVAGDGFLGEGDRSEALALALGFTFTEGIIDGLQDVATLAVCPDNPGVVRMQLADPEKVSVRRRNVVMNSSCGVCGGREMIENVGLTGCRVGDGLLLPASLLHRLMADMQARQTVFARTGGAHAAAVFGPAGDILAIDEDIGRHNALDKVIGRCIAEGRPLSGNGVVLSSRISLEMVVKAARAGFQVVAAMSAPTSLAVECAERWGITLCGFVRGDRLTVYTSPWRVADLDLGRVH